MKKLLSYVALFAIILVVIIVDLLGILGVISSDAALPLMLPCILLMLFLTVFIYKGVENHEK